MANSKFLKLAVSCVAIAAIAVGIGGVQRKNKRKAEAAAATANYNGCRRVLVVPGTGIEEDAGADAQLTRRKLLARRLGDPPVPTTAPTTDTLTPLTPPTAPETLTPPTIPAPLIPPTASTTTNPNGTKGPKGTNVGVSGSKGTKGPKGANVGVSGSKGTKGPKGANVGVSGSKGTKGPKGSKSQVVCVVEKPDKCKAKSSVSVDSFGSKGTKGPKAANVGVSGSKGTKGPKASNVGLSGSKGTKGPKAANVGVSGLKGPKGSKGSPNTCEGNFSPKAKGPEGGSKGTNAPKGTMAPKVTQVRPPPTPKPSGALAPPPTPAPTPEPTQRPTEGPYDSLVPPPTQNPTPSPIQETEEAGEAQKISNDDPDRIDFGFAIQTNSPPTDVQRVADALESFGTTLFNTTAEYSYRFMSFEVDPIPSTSVAVSRGGWKQRRYLEEQSHSSPFVSTLTLDNGTNIDGSAVQEEEVKQFFLNALRNATVSTDTLDDCLLGQWTAVETDAVPQVPPADPIDSSDAETVVVKSTTTTTSSYDSINSAVGIAVGVISACLVIFLVVHYKCRST